MMPLELRFWLEERGAVYGRHFTFGGLGVDTPGFEVMDGFPYTYVSKRDGRYYRKTDYQRHETQEAACDALKQAAIARAEADGVWSPRPEDSL